MKLTFVVILCTISILSSCQNSTNTNMQNSEITEKNIVNKLYSNVKHYDYEPMYYLTFIQNSCFSEILINDFPVNKNFQKESQSKTLDINNYIFKSGIQKVTFRLYPAGKVGLIDFSTLVADTEMKIQITESDNNKRDIDGKKISSYETPTIRIQTSNGAENNSFQSAGKSYFEASFTFVAKVPYELEGFEDAQNLKELDRETLEKKLLLNYKKIKEVYQSKNYDDIARISFDNLKNQFISEYQTREQINEVWEMLMNSYKQPTFEMQPIENYKMVFFADGKLVVLMQESKDSRLRGNTSLWAKFDKGQGVKALFCNRYFYIPKGEKEFKIF
ncbi:hypothetical protein [Flavobacterium humidisoli]|uniref:Lipoprotein n=1 Tax=Flavobacterium humidisoli TaxID=2937442 RepID=A0ABY4LV13_9FLAO|nr:hypothetical protein [Flavobacterium humidisoli]UPZ16913.1 hypothetical protein M0M44_06100 [Flavobacterium humidisoli]